MNTSSQNDNDNDIRQITSELEAIEQRLQAIFRNAERRNKAYRPRAQTLSRRDARR
ncbi:hypothetical protein [Kingella oralis]|uniref:hypothetical protein n=1 Tax=Kingella oralis TaxID=505 RepID=UPI002D7F7CC6|nr:hypothetical protein [Kingella oralis]